MTSREWLTPAECAGLADMPGTDRGCRKWLAKAAAGSDEKKRQREGTKAVEYHISLLPPAAQKQVRIKHAMAEMKKAADGIDKSALPGPTREERAEQRRQNQIERQKGMARFAQLPRGRRRDRALARQHIVRMYLEYHRESGLSQRKDMPVFVAGINDGSIEIPGNVREMLSTKKGLGHHLGEHTLSNWVHRYRKLGIGGLIDDYGKRKGKSKIACNPELKGIVLGLLHDQPHINGKEIKAFLQARHPELDIVSERSIDRFLASWKEENHSWWMYYTNPDAWKDNYMPAFGSHSEGIERLNQVWEMDSTPADWMLTDGRHSVVGVIDLYSRRLKLYVSKTSTAQAICTLFRRAVLDWGVPEIVRTDNGRDYTSNQFTGVLEAMGVKQQLCMPFASEQKGTIERALQTYSHGILKLLPGFIGHNVDERKKIEARKSFAERIMAPGEEIEVSMSSEDLQAAIDDWVEHIYHKAKHEGLGKSPLEVVAEYRDPVQRIEDERALDMLLAQHAGTAIVGKKGIRHQNQLYIHPELALHIKEPVTLRYDESDFGRLYVYGQDGEFICIAEAPEVTGISRAEVAAAAKAKANQLMSAQRKEAKEHKKRASKDVVGAVIEHRKAQAGNVVAMPQPAQPYQSRGLDEAAKAARADATGQPDGTEAPAQTSAPTTPSQVLQMYEGMPNERHAMFRGIKRRVEQKQFVTKAEREALEHYMNSDDWRRGEEIFNGEDFDASVYDVYGGSNPL